MDTHFSVGRAVLATVQDHLDTAGIDIGSSYVTVGQPVWDDCCEGLLIVQVVRAYRTVLPFPQEAQADSQCDDTPIAVDLLIHVARCAPVVDNRGNAPKVSELEAAYEAAYRDAAVVWNAAASREMLGFDPYDDPLWERANLSQSWPEPSGGCLGTDTFLTLGIPQWRWCVDAQGAPAEGND